MQQGIHSGFERGEPLVLFLQLLGFLLDVVDGSPIQRRQPRGRGARMSSVDEFLGCISAARATQPQPSNSIAVPKAEAPVFPLVLPSRLKLTTVCWWNGLPY